MTEFEKKVLGWLSSIRFWLIVIAILIFLS